MLGKLFKHEMKATSRSFLLMYGALILIAIFGKLFIFTEFDRTIHNQMLYRIVTTLEVALLFTYIIFCIAVFIMTFVFIVTRFYKNLTGDEGYLMHTLPVTTTNLILSKTFAAAIWFLMSLFVFGLSIFILVFNIPDLSRLPEQFHELWQQIPSNMIGQVKMFIFLYIVIIIVSTFYSILEFYMCIAIGQLFNSHRVLGSIGAYFGLNFIMQIISTIATIPFTLKFSESIEYMTDPQIMGFVNAIFGISILIVLVMTAIFFFITRYLLSKKLNLE